VVGRDGLEPSTSAVIGPERCAYESGRSSVTRGVIRCDSDQAVGLWTPERPPGSMSRWASSSLGQASETGTADGPDWKTRPNAVAVHQCWPGLRCQRLRIDRRSLQIRCIQKDESHRVHLAISVTVNIGTNAVRTRRGIHVKRKSGGGTCVEAPNRGCYVPVEDEFALRSARGTRPDFKVDIAIVRTTCRYEKSAGAA
jgi:hypothetical protein